MSPDFDAVLECIGAGNDVDRALQAYRIDGAERCAGHGRQLGPTFTVSALATPSSTSRWYLCMISRASFGFAMASFSPCSVAATKRRTMSGFDCNVLSVDLTHARAVIVEPDVGISELNNVFRRGRSF